MGGVDFLKQINKCILRDEIGSKHEIFLAYLSRESVCGKGCPKRLPVSPFSRLDLYHRFRNGAFYELYNLLKVQKTGKREVVLGQPLPQTLYLSRFERQPRVSRVHSFDLNLDLKVSYPYGPDASSTPQIKK